MKGRVVLAAVVITAVVAAALVWRGVRRPDLLREYVPRPAKTLTFNADIAPIIFSECAPCHRPGESAPFPLLDYGDVHKHAEQIVEVTLSRFMPPWLPEPGYGKFIGERRLSVDEIGRIKQWVDEGGERGEPEDLPPQPGFAQGWQLGEPDLILEMPEVYSLAPGGLDVFRNFVFPVNLAETRYVTALEFRPENPRAIHHATMAVDPTTKSRFHDQRDDEPGFDGMINSSAVRPDGHMLGWVPGRLPHRVSDDIAWRLEPDTDLIVQLHMQPSGKPETVRPRLGLFFSDEPPTRTPVMIRLGPRTIDVAPGESDYAIEDTFVLPVDVDVLAVAPHAHYLGKEMQAFATLPDGTQEWLIYIKEWDFNWQDEYRYVKPVSLPKGTTLSMRFTFDNSSDNVRNPHDPPRRVVFGPNTTDEMGDLWIQLLPRNGADRAMLAHEFQRKELQANLDCYEKMLEVDPRDVAVRVELGELHQQRGALKLAVVEFERALQIDPDHVPALTAGGRALHSVGRVKEAIEQFRKALQHMPELAEVHFNLGQSLFALERVEEAEEEYRVALELRPDLASAHHSLGEVHRMRGELDAAIDEYRRALAIDPDQAQSHNNLGIVLAMQKRLDEAIRHFNRAVELRPDHQPSQRNLAHALRMQEKAASD